MATLKRQQLRAVRDVQSEDVVHPFPLFSKEVLSQKKRHEYKKGGAGKLEGCFERVYMNLPPFVPISVKGSAPGK